MKISHAKARQLIQSAADQIPNPEEHTALDLHLQNCVECAEYAERLPKIERLLTNSLQQRWPEPTPLGVGSHLDVASIHGLTRRKQQMTGIFRVVRGLAWAGFVVVMVLAASWAINNMRAQDFVPSSSQITTPPPDSNKKELPVVGPVSTESFTNGKATDQHQLVPPKSTPTASPTKFAGLESVLSTTDLNCDGVEERITGISGSKTPYFDTDRWQVIKLESLTAQGPELVWEYTAEQAGVAYLLYDTFLLDDCHQLVVLIGYRGKERIQVFSWNGKQMNAVLAWPGSFFPADTLSPEDFGIQDLPANTFVTYEFNSSTTDSKVTWTLWGFEWDGEKLIPTIEKRIKVAGGG